MAQRIPLAEAEGEAGAAALAASRTPAPHTPGASMEAVPNGTMKSPRRLA